MYVIIVYPNSHSTEVRARCAIRGVPQLGAANRLDLEELISFDRDSGSTSSMLGSSGECDVLSGVCVCVLMCAYVCVLVSKHCQCGGGCFGGQPLGAWWQQCG